MFSSLVIEPIDYTLTLDFSNFSEKVIANPAFLSLMFFISCFAFPLPQVEHGM